MNVTFACPRCEESSRVEVTLADPALACPRCDVQIPIEPGTIREDGLEQCLVCGSRDLFIRKDFPQRLGVGIVVAGFVASSIAWSQYMTVLTFGILFATALIDVLLYLVVGEAVVCYRCQAQYRRMEGMEQHGAFSLETHERYRQQAARLAEQRQT
jgi:hypothetical protein